MGLIFDNVPPEVTRSVYFRGHAQLPTLSYLYIMSKMRKIALLGIGGAVVLTVLAVIFDFPPVIGGIHALPFCMLLIIDSSRKKTE